jgi:uncharacterized membrane protein YfcA
MHLMQRFLLVSLFGLIAQFIDGSLGMAYGVTATTMLLAGGVAPAMASASVHLAEVGTTLASGVAHWKLGNSDWRAIGWMAVPGGFGAFAGALLLTSISAEAASRWISAFLLCLGGYILLRFTFGAYRLRTGRRIRGRYLAPLGLGAGFLDAAGGGGWGPIATPALLASGRMEPRKVVGTVDTSEFLVSLGASAGFLFGLNRAEIPLTTVAALLVGGVIAAPFAAWLVRIMHPRLLGAGVGGLIIFTTSRTLLKAAGYDADARYLLLTCLALLWLGAVAVAAQAVLGERAQRQASATGD